MNSRWYQRPTSIAAVHRQRQPAMEYFFRMPHPDEGRLKYGILVFVVVERTPEKPARMPVFIMIRDEAPPIERVVCVTHVTRLTESWEPIALPPNDILLSAERAFGRCLRHEDCQNHVELGERCRDTLDKIEMDP